MPGLEATLSWGVEAGGPEQPDGVSGLVLGAVSIFFLLEK